MLNHNLPVLFYSCPLSFMLNIHGTTIVALSIIPRVSPILMISVLQALMNCIRIELVHLCVLDAWGDYWSARLWCWSRGGRRGICKWRCGSRRSRVICTIINIIPTQAKLAAVIQTILCSGSGGCPGMWFSKKDQEWNQYSQVGKEILLEILWFSHGVGSYEIEYNF